MQKNIKDTKQLLITSSFVLVSIKQRLKTLAKNAYQQIKIETENALHFMNYITNRLKRSTNLLLTVVQAKLQNMFGILPILGLLGKHLFYSILIKNEPLKISV